MAESTEISDFQRFDNAAKVHVGHGEVPFAVVPNDHTIKDLESLQARPRRIRQTIKAFSLDSFVEYVRKWRNDATLIVANDDVRSLEAVLDYHANVTIPSWCTHVAQYGSKLSREALAWQAQDGKPMSQMEFAEFLEEHIADVVEPAGAILLEQALKLQVIRQAVFGSVARLHSGEFQLNWSEENQKGTVELPEKIQIGIPLFHKGTSYRITARLRYRLNEGKVTFVYKLNDWQRSIEHAFDEVVKNAAAGIKGETGADVSILRATR